MKILLIHSGELLRIDAHDDARLDDRENLFLSACLSSLFNSINSNEKKSSIDRDLELEQRKEKETQCKIVLMTLMAYDALTRHTWKSLTTSGTCKSHHR